MTVSQAVPTSSIIARNPKNVFEVCVIRQTQKHNARLTLVGGRLELHRGQTFLECAHEEWDQEAGGKGATLENVWLWAFKNDPYSDVRPVTLGKLSFDQCSLDDRSIPVTGHYGAADNLFIGQVKGTPFPNDHEAKECLYVDVRDIVITENEADSKFGAQHDLVLAVYRLQLERGYQPALDEFGDLKALRTRLIALQQKYGIGQTVQP